MILSGMLKHDEDALICDLAETYHVLDMKALAPLQAAVLASGLRNDARIMASLRRNPTTSKTEILAAIADYLAIIKQALTHSQEGGKPKLLSEIYFEAQEPEKEEIYTPEEFKLARERILKGEREKWRAN